MLISITIITILVFYPCYCSLCSYNNYHHKNYHHNNNNNDHYHLCNHHQYQYSYDYHMFSPLVRQRGMRRASLCHRYCLPALSRPHDDCLTIAGGRGEVEVEVLKREERD